MSWPTRRTAILVIHGVGQQSPFETLDSFVRGLLETLEVDNPGAHIQAVHGLLQQDGWTTNYVSLRKDENAGTAIDCFEYYWAHQTQRQVQNGDVFNWLVETGRAASRYYEENDEIVKAYERPVGPFTRSAMLWGKPKFDRYWYLKQLGAGLVVLRPLLALLGALSSFSPAGRVIRGLLNTLLALVRPVLADFAGDIVIYTAADMKSRHFETRKRILDGAVASIRWLLELRGAPEYPAVIVAGHSLGSVIGYDALNRVNNDMNVDGKLAALAPKLKGFVTFGSPLDKVAFFFRGPVKEDRYIRRQILAQHVGFKARNMYPKWQPPHPLGNTIQPLLGHVRWINFWGVKDPISGPLDFYDLRQGDNRELDLGRSRVRAHGKYWDQDAGMYQQLARDLLG